MDDHLHITDVSEDSFEQQVIQESRQRPVLVDYWADWCGPCKALAPILSRVVEDLEGQIRLAKVDTEANQGLAMDHGIRSLPTVRLFRDGAPVAEFMGAQPESAIRDFIDRHAGLGPRGPLGQARSLVDAGDWPAARQLVEGYLAEQPDDVEARVLLAELNMVQGDLEAARDILDELPAVARQQRTVAALAARVNFAFASARAADAPAADEQSIEGRFQGALRAISDGAVEDGMQTLLAIMQEDRSFRDDGARKALLDAFLMLPADDARVGEYRSRMFSLLH